MELFFIASLRCKLIFNTQQFILNIILFVDLYEFLKSIPNMAKIWRCLSVHKQIISYFFLNFKVPCLLTLYLPGFFFSVCSICVLKNYYNCSLKIRYIVFHQIFRAAWMVEQTLKRTFFRLIFIFNPSFYISIF